MRLRRAGLAALLLSLSAGCAAGAPEADVPAAPGEPWTPAAPLPSARRPRAEVLERPVAPEPGRVYGLAELIDLAERANPQTRRAWEMARAAGAGVGEAEAPWYPTLALVLPASWRRYDIPSTNAAEIYRLGSTEPTLALSWLLFDFGRRNADLERARQALLAANFAFNRTHQDVAFAVQRSYYAYDAARADVAAAEASLATAEQVELASRARRERGLATRPDELLAVQETARARYELEDARGRVDDAWAALAASVGVPPVPRFEVGDSSSEPLPAELPASVEAVIDAALEQRPDLAARLAELRAREAEVRRAQAEFLPRVDLAGSGGGAFRHYNVRVPRTDSSDTFDYAEPAYGAGLRLEWTLFDGFLRESALRRSEAEAGAARSDLEELELRALQEIWSAYADARTSLRKYEFSEALLAASQEAYDAELRSYRTGLVDLLGLLTAQRDLARARSIRVASRSEVLGSAAALAWAAGGPLGPTP